MKKFDYIIVGLGIAGISFAETLQTHKKSFIIFDNGNEGSTAVSGGVLNPTVLKRFTAAWNSAEFVNTAFPFYRSLSEKLGSTILKETEILRIFNSFEEQNNWMVASDKKEMQSFISTEILKNNNPNINAPFGFGKVNGGATMNPTELIKKYREYLEKHNWLVSENIDYQLLNVSNEGIKYKNINSQKIIFTEGSSAAQNPYFPVSVSPNNDKVFVANKGEYCIIKAPELKLNSVLKGPMMLIPMENDLYKVGATYSRDDFSKETTEQARAEISEKLKKMINCPFEIVDQVSGIRPTIKDRKPLLGTHPGFKNIAFLNGLGTRGLSMAPLLSEQLYAYLEDGIPISKEIDLQRFLL